MNVRLMVLFTVAAITSIAYVGAQNHNVSPQTRTFTALVLSGTAEQIQQAIDNGADAKALAADGWTILMHAVVKNRDPDVISVLLKAGGDVNTTYRGYSPLMAAAQYNRNPAVIAALLKAGAEVNAAKQGDGKTALIYATSNPNNFEIIHVLLQAGADRNARDQEGRTAYYYANTYAANLKGTQVLAELKTTQD